MADADVIVIGAGLAGLTSAYDLNRAGHKVQLLEAQARPGGRVKTLRTEFSDGLYADAGAHFIPDRHKQILYYAKQFQLPLIVLPNYGIHYFLHGMRQSVPVEFEKSWQHQFPLALTERERELGWLGMIDAYINTAVQDIGDPTAPGWPPPSIKKYDDMSFIKFLQTLPLPPSEGAIDLLCPFLWWGSRTDLESVSALSMLRQQSTGFSTDRYLYTIRGGMDALPKAFANRLGSRISYRSHVVSIKQGNRSVKVTYAKNSPSRQRHTVTAKRVIIALPPAPLRKINVVPRFSEDKHQAVEQLSTMSVARVYLQCRQRVWPLNGTTFTDLPIQNLSEPTLVQPGKRKILESYISSDQAKTILQLKERDRIPFILGQAQMVYPDIAKSFERGAQVCWDEDDWAGGAYSLFKPKEMFKYSQALLTRPEGRVHFAGDHTSSRPGWMEGAIESGLRAAQEVFEALKCDV